MQLAIAVGSMLGIGGGSAAAGVGAAATTWAAANAGFAGFAAANAGFAAAGAAGAGLGIGGILSGIGTAAGTVTTIGGMIAQGTLTSYSAAARMRQAQAEISEAKIEELDAATQASRDKVAAEDEATRISRALAQTIGEQAAAFAAGGIALGSGSPELAKRDAQRLANEDLSINRANRNAKVAAWGQRAWAARARAANAFAGAKDEVRAMWGNFAVDTLNRGVPGLF